MILGFSTGPDGNVGVFFISPNPGIGGKRTIMSFPASTYVRFTYVTVGGDCYILNCRAH